MDNYDKHEGTNNIYSKPS